MWRVGTSCWLVHKCPRGQQEGAETQSTGRRDTTLEVVVHHWTSGEKKNKKENLLLTLMILD